MPLLRTLLPKDLLDIAPDVLRDTWVHTPRPDGVPEGIWAAFVLCPRVGYEQLLPQRRELTTYFSEKRSAVFRRDPAALWAWLMETIAPSTLSPSPLAALTLRQASPEAKRVLFAALCRALGVPAEQVMAIGDSGNDAAMLDFAGIGVAMGNGEDALKQRADLVAPSNELGGVADMLELVLQGGV